MASLHGHYTPSASTAQADERQSKLAEYLAALEQAHAERGTWIIRRDRGLPPWVNEFWYVELHSIPGEWAQEVVGADDCGGRRFVFHCSCQHGGTELCVHIALVQESLIKGTAFPRVIRAGEASKP
jgi:hypothetical protein